MHQSLWWPSSWCWYIIGLNFMIILHVIYGESPPSSLLGTCAKKIFEILSQILCWIYFYKGLLGVARGHFYDEQGFVERYSILWWYNFIFAHVWWEKVYDVIFSSSSESYLKHVVHFYWWEPNFVWDIKEPEGLPSLVIFIMWSLPLSSWLGLN